MTGAIVDRTPRDDGFAMPPEWAPHGMTIMQWPSKAALWDERLEAAFEEYANVANAIAAFEPLLMLADPSSAAEARGRLRDDVEILEVPLDDAWARDSGPIFVTDGRGSLALVDFRFNGWGGKFPFGRDQHVPAHVAEHLGVPRYEAPFVLEGGSFFVDGEGTLLTTEQCLLHPNRNPDLGRDDIERLLGDYLGVDVVVWLGEGHAHDPHTDGHVDDVAHFVAPGTVIVHAPEDPADGDHARWQENLRRVRAARDARGRPLQAVPFDPGTPSAAVYLNLYLTNGGAIVPIAGDEHDSVALARLREVYPDRELVPVEAGTILFGGGGPHCITQQVPAT
ncbi:MAG: agmatine deiminase family protein [Actinomycetota bacterium]